MASKRFASVRITASFEADLGAIAEFLPERDAVHAYHALLTEIAETVIPNLERFPQMGRPFFSRGAGSVEAHEKAERLKLRIGDGELREYLRGDTLLLYAFMKQTVYLLAIRHHRQLTFDFERFWLEGR